MNCFHFRKILPLLIALVLFAAVGCAAAEAPAEEYYRVVWSPGPSYACGRTEVPLLVLSDDPARQTLAEDEIRFFPFDAETGLYAGGEGEPAGDRAKILNDPGIPVRYYVTLSEPGKYLIAGYECYILDPQVPALKALYEELESLMESSEKPKEAQTAKALHDWLCGRVKAVIPEEEAARLSAACADPANALLTGYALREAYAPLYRMLLNAAGIRCLNVSGTAGGEAAEWTCCRLDGSWVWTDAAMDDLQDKKTGKYMALNDSKIEKDHTLSDGDRAFVEKLLRPATYDALLDGTLPISWLKYYEKKDLNFAFLRSDDPPITVGDSMTMTFHLLTNETEKYRNMTPEEFLQKNMTYSPWMEEYHAYYEHVAYDLTYQAPPVSELVTVESAAEDLSTFTVTFREPGHYQFFGDIAWCVSVYLISPDQTEPAALAAEIEAVVAEAKKAPTETAAAQKLMTWLRKKVKYNYAYYNGSSGTDYRDGMAAKDGFSGMLYGKTICDGYADAYDLLLRSAGITDFVDGCIIFSMNMGHAYNLNRLDGVWSFTDATWNLFNWAKEKMDKDREAYYDSLITGLFFGSPFDLMAKQLGEDCLQGTCLPRALKTLPLNAAEGYGFEDHLKDLIDAEVSPAEEGITLTMNRPASVALRLLKDGKPVYIKQDRSSKAVSSFTSPKFSMDESFQVEIGNQATLANATAFPLMSHLSKASLFERLDYEDGKPVRAEYYYFARIKDLNRKLAGYAQQIWEYGLDHKPVSVSWYLQSEDGDVRLMSLKIFFDGEGNAERYAVKWRIHLKDIQVSWEATADGVLTSYNGQPVENPDDVPLSRVDLITFR